MRACSPGRSAYCLLQLAHVPRASAIRAREGRGRASPADSSLLLDLDEIKRINDTDGDRARELAQKRIDSIGRLAKAAGVRFASVITKADTAFGGIIDTAKKRKCDVIFMASHGRRGFSRLMMGSVTQKVLAHSKIPVMVYR
jgi:nucleotide-binding universal stress UspA family protein